MSTPNTRCGAFEPQPSCVTTVVHYVLSHCTQTSVRFRLRRRTAGSGVALRSLCAAKENPQLAFALRHEHLLLSIVFVYTHKYAAPYNILLLLIVHIYD